MEISNNDLIKQADRIRQKQETVHTKADIQYKTDEQNNSNSAVSSPGTRTDGANKFFASRIRNMDASLKDYQTQVSQKQQLRLALEEYSKAGDIPDGKELMLRIRQENSSLSNFLDEGNWSRQISGKDFNGAQSMMKEIFGEIDSSLQNLYVKIEQSIQKSQIELENYTAAGFQGQDDVDKIKEFISSYQENMNSLKLNIKRDNIDSLLS